MKPMTASLLHHLNKYVLYNLAPAVIVPKLELPLITPLIEFLTTNPLHEHTCNCCGWSGTELKARKHYLVVETIAEVELFCPNCNQYLGFISESLLHT